MVDLKWNSTARAATIQLYMEFADSYMGND